MTRVVPLTARGRTTENARAVTRCAAPERWCHPQASQAIESPDEGTARHPARQRAQKSGKHLPSKVFQLARRARAQQLAQNQTQVERTHVDQLPLQNVFLAAQMAAPHPARLVAVREAALDPILRHDVAGAGARCRGLQGLSADYADA